MKNRKRISNAVYHVCVTLFGLIMLYPLFWMFFSSFKETHSILQNPAQLLPDKATLDNYITGWKGFGGVKFGTFLKNSLFVSVVGTIGTLASSACVAYAFARFRFRGRKLLFTAMMVSMMLPGQVLMVPQYLWYRRLGWVGGYAPLIVPVFFAIQGFFVYLMMNFIQGIPTDLDEAAKIDGCSYYGIFAKIILPLMSPAFITSGVFSFMWRWDDFMGPLLYLDDVRTYTVSLALKLFSDPTSSTDYGALFAMSVLAILPSLLIFVFLQKYLVEGVASTGIKG